VVRIVSLLPSATEILFALGAGEDVVGVSFECDFPPEARSRRIVSSSTLPAGLTPRQIDAEVRSRLAAGQDLYRLDEGTLRELDPDLILTQDLCAVSAVGAHRRRGAEAPRLPGAGGDRGSTHLAGSAGFHRHGRGQDRASPGGAGVGRCVGVPARPGSRSGGGQRPTAGRDAGVDRPPFHRGTLGAGDGVGGGTPTLGESGHRSEATTWDAVVRSRPDVVVCSPCGYGLAAAVELATQVRHAGHLPQGLSVWAVDADAAFVRPGPRLIDGVEALAGICHPGVVRRGRTSPYGSDPSGVAQAGRRSAKTNPSRSVISPTTTSRLVANPGPSTTKV